MSDDVVWEDDYRKLEGRGPRPLLDAVLERFPPMGSFHAVDLGSGDGTETLALLARGWSVTAIDGEPAALTRLLASVPRQHEARLTTVNARFEDVVIPAADLVYATYSLPFCPPHRFEHFRLRIVEALPVGGRFAGQLFGVNDSWASESDMTFHDADDVTRLLEPFDVESLDESEWDGRATSGPKHWHLFQAIARKR